MTASPAIVLWSGYTVACLAEDGWIDGGRDGLYDFDTRLLSRYRLTVDGTLPEVVSAAQPESDRWEAILQVARQGGDAAGPILPQDALEIRLRRRVGRGLIDELRVRNHSAEAWSLALTLDVEADFADVSEIGKERLQRGAIDRAWDGDARALTLEYRVAHGDRQFQRAVRVSAEVAADRDPEPVADGLRIGLQLSPGAERRLVLRVDSRVDGEWRRATLDEDGRSRQRAAWRSRRPRIDGPERLATVVERAADDLFDLRNWELEATYASGRRGAAWVLNAGVPSFTGFFGRDTLTAAWQSALLGPRAAIGGLAVAARTQATEDDPWRDAEPGKMIHEMRRGPLSDLGVGPRDRYYGTQTTPAMFVLALSELWHWTGDASILRRYRDPALRAFEWAETYGDPDGDGFLEYERRSPKGLRNQAWKDSDEAIRYPDGRLVDGPVATVEEQAFHFIALQRMAEILVALGEDARADEFLRKADTLRERWHAAFWMPDERYYALALDGAKRQVRSITSNPGHALGTGIVPPEPARDVASRLLSDELFSGWGVRTLSSRHPSYNPFAYHLGAVWPVEQATFALGMKRYGLDAEADRLIAAIFEAAERCPDRRVPEALSGHHRGELARPVFYPAANSPQAWSSSALVQLVQIMLGIYPFAPLRTLSLVRPRLPEWLPELTLRRLRVGRASVDIRFERRPDGSAAHRVLRRTGPLMVVTAGPPQASDTTELTVPERIGRVALDVAPGGRARAARIALGRTSMSSPRRAGRRRVPRNVS